MGKSPLPSSRRFLNPPPRSFLKTKKARKTFRTFLPNQMKICVYFGNINKPLCARGQRETSSLKSKYRAMLTSCRYKNDQGEPVVCMKDRFARKPAKVRSYHITAICMRPCRSCSISRRASWCVRTCCPRTSKPSSVFAEPGGRNGFPCRLFHVGEGRPNERGYTTMFTN